jgi:heme-degrading monooxygenase HmoA
MAETYTSGAWTVKEGEEEQFVAAWTDFVAWASGQPGSGTFRLVRDLDNRRFFVSFAPWESFDAQNAWKHMPDFPERLGRVRAHVDEFQPSTYELVAVIA